MKPSLFLFSLYSDIRNTVDIIKSSFVNIRDYALYIGYVWGNVLVQGVVIRNTTQTALTVWSK